MNGSTPSAISSFNGNPWRGQKRRVRSALVSDLLSIVVKESGELGVQDNSSRREEIRQ
jgi:hypothetical protein